MPIRVVSAVANCAGFVWPAFQTSQRMNDLEATSLRLLICRLDLIADMNRDHRASPLFS
jgi:hypothetical protein